MPSDSADTAIEDADLWVCRQPGDARSAKYSVGQLANPHWSDVSGGFGARASDNFIHGYVMCDEYTEGELGHSGSHGPCPHRIKVCVTQVTNSRKVFTYLKELAGPKPKRITRADMLLDGLCRAGEDGTLNSHFRGSQADATALKSLHRRGLASYEMEMRPNSTGRISEQGVWRVIDHESK